ncbi:hypothetical protein [Mesorhizobium sp. B2-3-5]|uniref:hypothetical protein n=1 Tax=Mesorhizobium sp. B2-3-5 TaxID=2589958 RepID=UPI001125BF36|nr:hypothetical protein [Mesorhizobium sp. B2-3-5]TPM15520.1 hypothetical protein FJ958_29655 [Mesorhizobium sp. B2-3-5]
MTKAARRKPVTLDEIEAGLDLVARLMEKFPRQAELMFPHWRALERERGKCIEAATILAAAKARLAGTRV